MLSPLPIFLVGLGQVIRRLRKQTGDSQERFASLVGVHRTYMGHLERGTANPTVKTLHLVAQSLGMSIGELITLAEREGTLRKVAEPSARGPRAPKRKM